MSSNINEWGRETLSEGGGGGDGEEIKYASHLSSLFTLNMPRVKDGRWTFPLSWLHIDVFVCACACFVCAHACVCDCAELIRLGHGCWQNTRGNHGHSANVLPAQGKKDDESSNVHWSFTCSSIMNYLHPLIKWMLPVAICIWTHTHTHTHCINLGICKLLQSCTKLTAVSSTEIIIMITKAAMSSACTWPRTQSGERKRKAWDRPDILRRGCMREWEHPEEPM